MECRAENPGKMLDAGIQSRKFRQLVQSPVAKTRQQRLQVLLDVDDVYQVTMTIQRLTFQLNLNLIMMGMQLILGSPVAPYEKMLGDEISFDCNGVHDANPFPCNADSQYSNTSWI